ncbi:hypothetical protein R1flu_001418 [Riccia fluitans]|uniref:Uncharacterized protein n=1 Tax=Riccia fluitans TaxID=41844 RepID=A0ABD1Y3G5_9MARC
MITLAKAADLGRQAEKINLDRWQFKISTIVKRADCETKGDPRISYSGTRQAFEDQRSHCKKTRNGISNWEDPRDRFGELSALYFRIDAISSAAEVLRRDSQEDGFARFFQFTFFADQE